jgi:membrane fusion protein (multidrug efflux system)
MRLFGFLCVLLALSACSAEEKRERPAPLVTLDAVATHEFVDRYVSVGTANANEQVSVRAPVTERITRLGFSDGSYVRQGQMLAVLAQGQETASLASANARAIEAEKQLARVAELHRRGFATNASLDSQTAIAEAARAAARPFPGRFPCAVFLWGRWSRRAMKSPRSATSAGSSSISAYPKPCWRMCR